MFALTACGFQLRGSYAVPPQMQFICFDDGGKYELGRALKQRLIHSKVSLIDDPSSCVSLSIVETQIDRQVLSLFPNAQVAEYELNFLVKYKVQNPNEETARVFTAQVVRDYQDDPEAVLAKSKEMKILLAELRRQAAEQIVLQLASLDNR
ncbi:LPS assembly lipoprotein LptE [Catenovulum sp. 2E275]|uniref:LPS-assembly lipoprotein LptE n=1 Tax=Catenovulum sp. 2E275 TaxID=2980497 RepID=UPI0021CFA0D8|nr:LPS assembly lipoprotein LptE [Catenovulum sp. 2E275]MCU4675434.1 LPS assembly lipoprotein LptE [Catenovulum sp. 2E275]